MLTITGDLDNSEKFKNSVEESYLENSKMIFSEKRDTIKEKCIFGMKSIS